MENNNTEQYLDDIVLSHKPNRFALFFPLAMCTVLYYFIFKMVFTSGLPEIEPENYHKAFAMFLVFPVMLIYGWVYWWKAKVWTITLSAQGLTCSSWQAQIDWMDIVGVEEKTQGTHSGKSRTYIEIDLYDFRKYIKERRWYQKLNVMLNAMLGYHEMTICSKDWRLNDERDIPPEEMFHLIKDYWQRSVKNDKRKYSV